MRIGTNTNVKTKDSAVFESSCFVTTEQGARTVLRLLYQSLHQSIYLHHSWIPHKVLQPLPVT